MARTREAPTVSKAKVTILVESEHGIITGEYEELEYDYPYVLSVAVRNSVDRMGELLEQRLEGVR